jgi:hypothetical protein
MPGRRFGFFRTNRTQAPVNQVNSEQAREGRRGWGIILSSIARVITGRRTRRPAIENGPSDEGTIPPVWQQHAITTVILVDPVLPNTEATNQHPAPIENYNLPSFNISDATVAPTSTPSNLRAITDNFTIPRYYDNSRPDEAMLTDRINTFTEEHKEELIKFCSLYDTHEQSIAITSQKGKLTAQVVDNLLAQQAEGKITIPDETPLFAVPKISILAKFFEGKLKDIPEIAPDYKPHENVFIGVMLTEDEKKSPTGEELNSEDLDKKLQEKKEILSEILTVLLKAPNPTNNQIAELFEQIMGVQITGSDGGHGTKREKLGNCFKNNKKSFALLLQQENALELLSEPFFALGNGCATNIATILDSAIKKFRIKEAIKEGEEKEGKILEIDRTCASILLDVYTSMAKQALNSINSDDPLGGNPIGIDIMTAKGILETHFSPSAFIEAIPALLQDPKTGKFKHQPTKILEDIGLSYELSQLMGEYEKYAQIIESDPKMAELASYAILKHAIGEESFTGAMNHIFNHKGAQILLKEQKGEDVTEEKADYTLMKQACEIVFKGAVRIRDFDSYISISNVLSKSPVVERLNDMASESSQRGRTNHNLNNYTSHTIGIINTILSPHLVSIIQELSRRPETPLNVNNDISNAQIQDMLGNISSTRMEGGIASYLDNILDRGTQPNQAQRPGGRISMM